jgi:hypothetical protein|tara:strand:- start:2424 stop:2729 length:306 start_codon:yes stop_codon:yes gene_type:complete
MNMAWFDEIKKERPHFNPDELTVAQVKDFIRRFRLEYLPKLKGQLEHDAHQWLGWLESGLKAMQTEEGNWQVFTNEYIVARLQDIMDEAGFSESDSLRGKE